MYDVQLILDGWDQRQHRPMWPMLSLADRVVPGRWDERPALATYTQACDRAKRLGLCGRICGKMSFFRNDDPYRHKNQEKSWTWSPRVCVPNFAVIRHGV